MAPFTFDTLSAARELEAKGVDPGQAEAIVTAIRKSAGEHITAKQFDDRFTESQTHVDGRFSEFRTYVDGRFSEFRIYVDGGFSELRSYVDVRFIEQQANFDSKFSELRALIDRQSVMFHRALWLQGVAIVGVLAGLYALVGGG